ncbi:unnamed protein product [Phytomonas sp. EM1]|nr:unnamed protein product [Phytomonas sp. EM1]|eukprot:CCW65249.1 unnamed protein product [Phytomonas sp. isolate EM1]
MSTAASPVHSTGVGGDISTEGLTATTLISFNTTVISPRSGSLFSDNDDLERNNKILQRLLNEATQVATSDDDAISNESEKGPLATFSIYAPNVLDDPSNPYGELPTGPSCNASQSNNGFIVEGSSTVPEKKTPVLHGVLPPPPPVYGGTPIIGASVFPYSGIPHVSPAITSVKAPPSFAEAIAKTTPLSMPRMSMLENSPMVGNYMHSTSATPQPADSIILRNLNGVFLLKPVANKKIMQYTPPTASNSPPISPLPRYTLPAAAGPSPSTMFLGGNSTQTHPQHTCASSYGDPPHYSMVAGCNGGAVNTPFFSGGVYTQSIASSRGTPSYTAAPPPYSAV